MDGLRNTPGTLNSLPSGNRVDEVHRALLHLMESGDLGVGDQLPTEKALAQKHGVSRPVVREAIARLAASGQLRTEHGKGSFVLGGHGLEQLRLVPITSIDDLLAWQELRLGIEQEAARLAATRHSHDDLAEIVRLHEVMVNDTQSDGYGGDTDHAFHVAIAAAAHNRAILDAQKALGRHIKGWISAVLHVESSNIRKRQQYRISEHEAIVSAIRERNPERASQALRSHIENGRTRFLTRLSRNTLEPEGCGRT
jgi:GntR family transcriptional repressor for pyruvate dehydrogenase complex